MISKSMMILSVTVAVISCACGPQYAPQPGTAEVPNEIVERGKEREITLDDVPEPVKRTILAEAGNHEVSEIEEVMFTDRTVYEAEWRMNGEEVEMKIAADGTILDRTTGDDDVDREDGKTNDDDKDDDEDNEGGDTDEAGAR